MNRKIYMALLSLALILGISGTSIYALTEVSVKNHFSTGIVDIELEEYSLTSDGKEVIWENMDDVLPDTDISKIPRIFNHGNDCYVRAKIHLEDTPICMDDIYGISERWMYADDGYFYYTEDLLTGEHVDLFEGIHIPSDLSETYAGTTFNIEIDVDAVQSKNFTPDYQSGSPWGKVEILECEKEGMYDITTFKKAEQGELSIRYEGDAGKLIKNEEDFFKNFPVFLPGDVYTDSLEFSNNSDRDISLYFRTAAHEEEGLIDALNLKIEKIISGKVEVLYEGTVRASELHGGVLLATLKKGEEGTLSYTLEMPEELQNPYSILEDDVVWVFSTGLIDNIDVVQTGDHTLNIGLTIMAIGGVLAFITVLMEMYMKRRKA